jgi:hypothetical protein
MNVGRWAQQGGGGGGEEEERKFIQNKPVNEADSERDRATPVRQCILFLHGQVKQGSTSVGKHRTGGSRERSGDTAGKANRGISTAPKQPFPVRAYTTLQGHGS